MNRKRTGILGSAMLLVATTIFASNAIAVSTVTVDGVKKAGEYTGNTGGTSSGSQSIVWYNNHHSIYTKTAANTNPLVWEIHNGGTDKVSLNLFFEVPTYARRMIWADGCDYEGTLAGSGCGDLAPLSNTAYLDSYLEGAMAMPPDDKPHKDSVKMDYKTQTESEFFELDGIGLEIEWQDVDGNKNNDFNWATSREYLIANSSNCSESLCTEFDKTSSIEIEWNNLSLSKATSKLNKILASEMQLHLSDEARGLPPISEVPVPAAFWLFGTALIGFIGYSRRTNLS